MRDIVKSKWVGPFKAHYIAVDKAKDMIPFSAEPIYIKFKSVEFDSGLTKEWYVKVKYIIP